MRHRGCVARSLSPIVISVTDDVGDTAGGVPITILGFALTGASGVLVGGSSATSVVVVNDTTITCVTPAHAKGIVDVVVQHPTRGNSTGGTGLYEYWNPTSISGCVGWWRADLGITLDGSNLVQTWADQSGIGDANRNATQATAGNRVAYSSSDANYNNKATVGSFNIAPQCALPTAVWSATYTTFTVGSVGHVPLGTTTRYFTFGKTTDYIALASSSAEKAWVLSGDSTVNLLEPGVSANTPKCVLIAEFNGASSNVYVNSTVTATVSGTLAASSIGDEAFNLGCRAAQAGTSGGCDALAETWVVNGIASGADKVKTRKYLNGRYGKSMST